MRSTPAWMRRLVVGGVSAVTMAGVGVVGFTGPAGATPSFTINTLAGPNRFATAAAIATAAYPKGAATVVLAGGLEANISDSLAAGYLAGQLNGGAGAPILLSEPGSLPPETLAALKTLGTTNIIVVGGSAAVGDSVVSTLQGDKYSVSRVAGSDRFATSQALDTVAGDTTIGTVGGTPSAPASSPTTNGVTLNSASVAAGGTVAGTLTNPTGFSTLTVALPGGTQTLTVNQTTGAFNFTIPATQVSGAFNLVFTATPTNGAATTTGTTVLTVNPANGNNFSGQKFAIIADGQDANLVDSLGSSPVSFADHFPVLLVNGPTGTLSAAQLAFLKASGVSTDVLIVGGTGAVGSQVQTQLVANGQTPINVAGSDRSSTSQALADFAIDTLGFSTSTFDIASGAPGHLIDSLAGGPYGGTRTPPAPTLITTDVTNPGAVTAFALEHEGTETSATVFGGTDAVAASALATITAAGQSPVSPGAVSLITSSAPVGGTITGTVNSPSLVKTLTVSGCGLNSAPVSFNATTGAFSVTIPSTALGTCTLTFTATLLNGTTLTSNESVTVTAPVAVTPVSGLTTGLGTPPVSGEAAPVLVSAQVTQNNFLGLSPSIVQYTFDQAVTPKTVADFSLQGYDTARLAATPTNVNQDASNPNVIDASFDPSFDVASYTLAVADNTGAASNGSGPSAVTGQNGAGAGLNNPLGSVLLGGSSGPSSTTAGASVAPDLIGAMLNPANNKQVFYKFDKPVEFTAGKAGNFLAYTAAGTPSIGSSSDNGINGSNVETVTFKQSVAAAVRFAVLPGAVAGTTALSAGVSNPAGSTNAATASPDLIAVTPVAGNAFQYDFVFDKAVSVKTGTSKAADYQVVLNDGGIINGVNITNVLNSNTVRVDFAPSLSGANAANVTLGDVLPGAATNFPSGLGNTVGAAGITGQLVNGGPTDGPALQNAVANATARTVTYYFNQAVTFPLAAGFFVINSAGAPTFASGVTTQGNTVVATFAGSIAPAVGAGVTSGGKAGFGNPFSGPGTETAGHNTVAVLNDDSEPNAPGDVTLSS